MTIMAIFLFLSTSQGMRINSVDVHYANFALIYTIILLMVSVSLSVCGAYLGSLQTEF